MIREITTKVNSSPLELKLALSYAVLNDVNDKIPVCTIEIDSVELHLYGMLFCFLCVFFFNFVKRYFDRNKLFNRIVKLLL